MEETVKIKVIKPEKEYIEKPWGSELWLVCNDKYALKIITINKGHRFSLQYHEKKTETWYLQKGRLSVEYDKAKFIMRKGDVVHVPPKTVHRLEALTNSEIIEVSTPELKDVVRLEDDYGRN